MKISEDKLEKILVEPGYINKNDFELAKKEAKEKKISLAEILVEKNLISDEHLGQLIANFLEVPFINLEERGVPEEIIGIIPELVAKSQEIIVFNKTKEGIKVAMTDPSNLEMINWLEKKTGEKVIPYYTTSRSINKALKFYRKKLKETFEEIIHKEAEKARTEKVKAIDLPIIKIVDTIIEYAYENQASDIHITPLEKETKVRFRIDGILHDVLNLPKEIHGLIVTRIKVLSKLRIDEHFAAQDGKFTVKFEREKFDIRVSIIPVSKGENIVMRLLSERSRRFILETLGLSENDLKKVKSAIKKTYGMILVSGPTGCGKTTTLYAILKVLNNPEVNICTIEDPIEYDIERVNQIQVNPKTNLTFSQGLRAIVRQDPDIIMVGEIRDEETADIAVNSAMTGHLVLSTIHANTAATTLTRLIDMRIEPFLIASSVNIVVAQRLVRKICLYCRESYEITQEELKKLGLPEKSIKKFFSNKKKIIIYRGKGCRSCVNTGYFGRAGIFEVLKIEDNIRKLIMEKANANRIEEEAIKNGMTTMLENGIEKMLFGITTIGEIIRVIRE